LKNISKHLQEIASRLLDVVRLSFLAIETGEYSKMMEQIQECLFYSPKASGRRNLLDLAVEYKCYVFLDSATVQTFVEWKMHYIGSNGDATHEQARSAIENRWVCNLCSAKSSGAGGNAMFSRLYLFLYWFRIFLLRLAYLLFPQEWVTFVWKGAPQYDKAWTSNALHWFGMTMYFFFVVIYTFVPWEHMLFFRRRDKQTDRPWPWWETAWPSYGEFTVHLWAFSLLVYEFQQVVKMIRDSRAHIAKDISEHESSNPLKSDQSKDAQKKQWKPIFCVQVSPVSALYLHHHPHSTNTRLF
jgi:hypothetical protein